jgi:hypothetical protein
LAALDPIRCGGPRCGLGRAPRARATDRSPNETRGAGLGFSHVEVERSTPLRIDAQATELTSGLATLLRRREDDDPAS